MSEPSAQQRQTLVDRALEIEPRLTRYAARLLGNADAAADVVQEAMLRLLRCAEPPPEPRLAEWLFTVARNAALDVLRKEGRMKPLSDEHAERVASTGPSPQAAAELAEDAGRLVRLMRLLPRGQQDVLRLRFQEQFSYKQIAGITGLTVTNVGFMIHTAIKTLRGRMVV